MSKYDFQFINGILICVFCQHECRRAINDSECVFCNVRYFRRIDNTIYKIVLWGCLTSKFCNYKVDLLLDANETHVYKNWVLDIKLDSLMNIIPDNFDQKVKTILNYA